MKRFKFLFITSVLFSLGLITPSQASLKDEFIKENQKSKYQKDCEYYYSQGQYSNPIGYGQSPEFVYIFTKPKDVYEIYMVQSLMNGNCYFAKVGIYQKNFTYNVCDKGHERRPFGCSFFKKNYSGETLNRISKYTTYFELEGDNLVYYEKRDGVETRKKTFPKIVDSSVLLKTLKFMKEKGK